MNERKRNSVVPTDFFGNSRSGHISIKNSKRRTTDYQKSTLTSCPLQCLSCTPPLKVHAIAVICDILADIGQRKATLLRISYSERVIYEIWDVVRKQTYCFFEDSKLLVITIYVLKL